MEYGNLKAEMGRKDITIEEVSKLLGIHRNSVANKVNGRSRFTVDEAKVVKEAFFPNLSIDYLFETAQTEKGA